MCLINKCWETLFDKYNIENEIDKNGFFYITSKQINEIKEARLMTKFDTKESLPKIFKNKKIAILPTKRGEYVMGKFQLYEDLPEFSESKDSIISCNFPDYIETININDIRSEDNAINAMLISGILDDFLDEHEHGMIKTVSGRMSSESFSFYVNKVGKGNNKTKIDVVNSQLEIDGGFENNNVFALMEGKNVINNDFLIRQLYYPYRLWSNKIDKPIRNIFMVYSNNVFKLMEYKFSDLYSYNSLKLVQSKRYSFEDSNIELEDLKEIFEKTKIKKEPDVTFIQANSFDKVISLIENLDENGLSEMEVADLFGFDRRQSGYYYNACKYLRLVKKDTFEGETKIFLTNRGKSLKNMSYKKRQLSYVEFILEHKIYNDLFKITLNLGEIPEKSYIIKKMKELSLCSDSLLDRRSSSVKGWLSWIFNLVNQNF